MEPDAALKLHLPRKAVNTILKLMRTNVQAWLSNGKSDRGLRAHATQHSGEALSLTDMGPDCRSLLLSYWFNRK